MSKLALSVACLLIVSMVFIKPGLSALFSSPTNNFEISLILYFYHFYL